MELRNSNNPTQGTLQKWLAGFAALFMITVGVSKAESQGEVQKLSAKEACSEDYWKWCAPTDAPYDCFKRRGFFKKDSILSPECKRAWSKPKARQEARPEPEADVAPAPKSLNAHPKKPASEVAEKPVERSADEPKKSAPSKSSEEVDDFSELDFN